MNTIMLIATFALAGSMAAQSKTMTAKATPTKSEYLQANGIKYYYEVHGEGEPLLLLHGGLGSIELFEPGLSEFAQHRKVIAVDLHGHGRTPLGNREISLIDMGDDMAVIIKSLGFEQTDVLGYSMGGGVALRFAIQHPNMVRRLVLVSTPFAQNGFFPEMLPMQAQLGAAMAPSMKDTPIYHSYVALAPNPAEFPKLLDQMGAYMRKPYDWSAEVKQLKMPVMLIYGDSDMFRPEHIVEFYHLLGGGLKDAGWMREHMSQNRLAILPDLTHYEMSLSPEIVSTALPFLDGKIGVHSRDEKGKAK